MVKIKQRSYISKRDPTMTISRSLYKGIKYDEEEHTRTKCNSFNHL